MKYSCHKSLNTDKHINNATLNRYIGYFRKVLNVNNNFTYLLQVQEVNKKQEGRRIYESHNSVLYTSIIINLNII